MRLLLQRVSSASVVVGGETVGAVGTGLLALAGFHPGDVLLPDSPAWMKLLKKVLALRIFPDGDGRLNLSVLEYIPPEGDHRENSGTGKLLVVPQFTLFADCRKGLRPSFHGAAAPDVARILYERLVADFESLAPGCIAQGRFGADMDVHLVNWGPVTIMLDSDGPLPRE